MDGEYRGESGVGSGSSGDSLKVPYHADSYSASSCVSRLSVFVSLCWQLAFPPTYIASMDAFAFSTSSPSARYNRPGKYQAVNRVDQGPLSWYHMRW